MDRLSLLNYGLRCTGVREESSIVVFDKVVMALSLNVVAKRKDFRPQRILT